MIDKAICLAVDKRKSLWKTLQKDCMDCLGIPLQLFIAGSQNDPELIYDHIDIPYSPSMNNYVGYTKPETLVINANIFLCHKKILQEAVEDSQNILLMEDDATFLVDRFKKIWLSEGVQDFVNSDSWDAIFLGWWQRKYESDSVDGTEEEYEWKNSGSFGIKRAINGVAGKISGLHGCLLNKKLVPKLLTCQRSPLDSFINQDLNRYKIFYIFPKIITSLSNYSYCENTWIERNALD